MKFLDQLRLVNITRDKEWAQDAAKPLSILFRVNELSGEVGEACNILKKLDREFTYKIRGSRDTLDHLAEEFSDIVICTDLMAMQLGVEFNELQWPSMSKQINEDHDYSLYGASLNALTGRACGIAIHYETHINRRQISECLGALVSSVKIFSDRLGIDLATNVVSKFNLTSYKQSLRTFFVREADLENE